MKGVQMLDIEEVVSTLGGKLSSCLPHRDCRTAAFLPCFGECHMSCHRLTRFEINAEVDRRV